MEEVNYYRMSEWSNDVDSWFEHHKRKGIPALLVRNPETGLYAVFVVGKEIGENPKKEEDELKTGFEVKKMYRPEAFNNIKIIIHNTKEAVCESTSTE